MYADTAIESVLELARREDVDFVELMAAMDEYFEEELKELEAIGQKLMVAAFTKRQSQGRYTVVEL